MAALGKIRKRGALLIAVVGLGLFAFIAEEAFRSCESTQNERRQQVGEVLGKKISVQQFQQLMEEYQDVLRFTQGRDNLTEEENNQLKDQIWNQFVSNQLIADECEKLGITVTDEELQNILREGTNQMLTNTPFINQQTGRFDVNQLTKFLDDYKKLNAAQNPQAAEQYQRIYNYWKFIEKNLRNQTLAMKYQSLLANSLLSNPISAQMSFDGSQEESTIQLAAIPYNSINDNSVQVSDADLKAKYNEQKAMFEQPMESRDIKYVDFQVVASQKDRAELMKQMNEVSEKLKAGEDPAEVIRKNKSNVAYLGVPVTKKALPFDISNKVDSMSVGQTTAPFETKSDNTLNVVKLISVSSLPDSVEYRQIQIGGATVDEARSRADSVYNAIKGGADFEALAKKYNQEGKAQWLTSAMYERSTSLDNENRNYIETITTTAVNDVKNVEFTQGNVIIQVTNRKGMVNKYNLAVVKKPIDFSKETYSAAYNKFSQFVSENQTIEAMEKNAAKFGFKVQQRNDLFSAEHGIANIRSTTEALRWVFDSKVGKVSPLYECGNNDHLLVIGLTKIHPAGYRSLDDVKDMLKAEVIRDKKFEQIKQNYAGVSSIEAAQKKGAQVSDVNQITFNAPVFVQATGASEPALSGAVASTKQGAFSKNLVKGNGGAYLFKVVEKKKGDLKINTKSEEQRLAQQAMQAAGRFMSELEKNAKVVDNRYMFF